MQKYYVVVFAKDDKDHIPGTYWFMDDRAISVNNLHRIGGPAIERDDGRKEWYENGKRHRIDGPAIEPFATLHTNIFWIEGRPFSSRETYDAEIARRNAPPDPCDGKTVEIDGKKYKLTLLK
jgi:hypothetical protein